MCKVKYIVRLQPIGGYFFGGEVTFGDGENQNYLVKSNLLPQASAILGLMRYVILSEKDLLEKDDKEIRVEWPKWIGYSFNIEDPKYNYGIIESISPVFVESNGVYYTPCPIDFGYSLEFKDDNVLYSSSCHSRCEIKKGKDPFSFKDFDNYLYWISSNNNERIKESDIFMEDVRVGISKSDGVADNEKSYFKQTLIRMKDGFNFVFTIKMSEDIFNNANYSKIVYLGGNRSAFKMTIAPVGDKRGPVESFRDTLKSDNRVLLLSDAYISKSARDGFDFIWGESIDNRYISNAHSWKAESRSKLYHLLRRGSVIYLKDSEELKELRESKSALNTVGLNIFV